MLKTIYWIKDLGDQKPKACMATLGKKNQNKQNLQFSKIKIEIK